MRCASVHLQPELLDLLRKLQTGSLRVKLGAVTEKETFRYHRSSIYKNPCSFLQESYCYQRT